VLEAIVFSRHQFFLGGYYFDDDRAGGAYGKKAERQVGE